KPSLQKVEEFVRENAIHTTCFTRVICSEEPGGSGTEGENGISGLHQATEDSVLFAACVIEVDVSTCLFIANDDSSFTLVIGKRGTYCARIHLDKRKQIVSCEFKAAAESCA